jgi:hypothetical protein
MRVRVAPAGKCLGEGVIPGADVFGCSLGIVPRCFQPLHDWLAGPMVKLVALGHHFRLCLRQLHQFRIERYGGQSIVGAITGDHRSCTRGVEFRARLRQVTVETWLSLLHLGVGTTAYHEQDQQCRGNTCHREVFFESWTGACGRPPQNRDTALTH